MIVCEDPEGFLIEHMVKGDSSDGIPNVLSDDDAIINPDKKQTIIKELQDEGILLYELQEIVNKELDIFELKETFDLHQKEVEKEVAEREQKAKALADAAKKTSDKDPEKDAEGDNA